MKILKLFVFALVLVPVIDYVWLAKIASKFYLRELGDLARMENGAFSPLIWAAVLVYVCLAAGVVFFVLPRIEAAGGGLGAAFLWGALFGLVSYGIYDMTNLSLVSRWPLLMSFVDIAWGGVLCGLVSMATYWLSLKLA